MSLTIKQVERLLTPGRYLDEHGLYLQVMSATNRSWVLRFQREGRERWAGLGPLHTINLKEARGRARKARQQLLDGIDPIEARLAERDAQRKEETERISFKQAAEKFLKLHEPGWRNAKHKQQWRNTLETYAYPILGARPVQAIDTALVNLAVAPIWSSIPETAARVRHRIERVIRWVRDGMPLPKVAVAKQRKNHPALPYVQLATFVNELRQRQGVSARALEFLILVAGRTNEVIGAKRNEFDLQQKLWTIPASRMKGGRQHRVPLSDAALELLHALPVEENNPFMFIGGRPGSGLSNMALLELMRDMQPDYVPHGFRSTFKDWCAETTNYPNIVSEMALAHKIPSQTEAAYRRGDLLDKRRRLMRDWAQYCTTKSAAPKNGKVVPIRTSFLPGRGTSI
jgi:integrase